MTEPVRRFVPPLEGPLRGRPRPPNLGLLLVALLWAAALSIVWAALR